MGNPVVWLTVATVVATGVQIQAQRAASKTAQRQHEYNAAVAENNAIAAKNEAQYEADMHDRKMKKILMSQDATYTGVTKEGTPLDLKLDTVTEGEMDRLAILYGGDKRATGYTAEAGAHTRAAGAEGSARQYAVAGTILGGTRDVLSIKAKYPKSMGGWAEG